MMKRVLMCGLLGALGLTAGVAMSTDGVVRARGAATNSYLPTPRVRARSAFGVHASSAVLRAEIDARDGIAHFKFQYGLTKKYETTLEPSEEYVTGRGFREVTEALTRLRPKTTYHFRVIAFNRSGFVVGSDRSFTTTRR
jgi:hypothetical protein